MVIFGLPQFYFNVIASFSYTIRCRGSNSQPMGNPLPLQLEHGSLPKNDMLFMQRLIYNKIIIIFFLQSLINIVARKIKVCYLIFVQLLNC